MSWTVEQGIVNEVLDIYAEYDGDGTYAKSKTARQQIEILSASIATVLISLGALPGWAYAVNEIKFTGRLASEGGKRGACPWRGYPWASRMIRCSSTSTLGVASLWCFFDEEAKKNGGGAGGERRRYCVHYSLNHSGASSTSWIARPTPMPMRVGDRANAPIMAIMTPASP